MKERWTLGTLALFAAAAVGCGNSSPTQTKPPRALVKFNLPEQVVGVPSTDSRFAMEAAIPMVVSETAGVGTQIMGMRVETANEATGATSSPSVVFAKSVEYIPAGGTVEMPFRVFLNTTGTYRTTVTLDTWDDGAPGGTAMTGGAAAGQLWDNPRSGERSQFSAEFRILPPQ